MKRALPLLVGCAALLAQEYHTLRIEPDRDLLPDQYSARVLQLCKNIVRALPVPLTADEVDIYEASLVLDGAQYELAVVDYVSNETRDSLSIVAKKREGNGIMRFSLVDYGLDGNLDEFHTPVVEDGQWTRVSQDALLYETFVQRRELYRNIVDKLLLYYK